MVGNKIIVSLFLPGLRRQTDAPTVDINIIPATRPPRCPKNEMLGNMNCMTSSKRKG